MRSALRYGLAGLLLASACGGEQQINLIIYDPCNQSVLPAAQHIQLRISGKGLSTPVEVTWNAKEGQGELPDLPLMKNATVSVTARTSNGNGDPGAAVGATTVGPVSLIAPEDAELVELAVAVGKIDSFASTTDTTDGVSCTNLLGARQGHTATLLEDGRVFIAGGERIDETTVRYWESTELFNPRTGAFDNGPTMGGWTRKGHTATRLDDGRVLLTGGIGLADDEEETWLVAQIYEPSEGSFSPTPLPMQEQRAYHTATLLDDGRVLLTGGVVDGRELATTEIYSPSSRTFTAGPVLREPRSHHAAVKIGPSTVALIGGRGSDQVLADIEFVNADLPTSTEGPSLSTARSHVAAAMVPGADAILVAGGFGTLVTAPEAGQGLDDVELILLNRQNLGSSTVDCETQLGSRRGAAGITTVGDELLVVGGVVQAGQVSATAERISVGSALTCDIAIESTDGAMASGRGWPVVTPLVGGDVLVTGGFSVAGGDVLTLTLGEVYVRPR